MAHLETLLDLQGMGASRTLDMINGRRMGQVVHTTLQQQIPTAMIERVDVLTGGASTVYGADAVAGVENIDLRDNF